MSKKKDPNVYPPGLNAAKVKRIIAYYDSQPVKESAAEILSAQLAEPTVWVEVPERLLPKVRKLLASRKRSA